jgi:uncharacterized protein YbjT (DUF2867 family)
MILVTGATGNVGGQVARALAAKGAPFRALVRRPDAADALRQAGATEVAVGDFTDAGAMARALEGVGRLFLVTASNPDQINNEAAAVAAAKAAGVAQIVKLSAINASADGLSVFLRWNRAGEENIERSGIAYTFLRPNGFFQNLLGQAGQIAQGALYAPAGDARISFVDVRDIADVAAAVLTEGGHAGEALDITGPEAPTHAEMAAQMSEVLGRPVQYVAIDDTALQGALAGSGLPEWQAEGVVGLYRMYRGGGRTAEVTDTVPRVAGHPARSLRDFLRDHAAVFTGAAA